MVRECLSKSPIIGVGQSFVTKFGDIRLIKLFDSGSGQIGIKPNGWSEVVVTTVDWRVEDVGPMTVETNFFTLAGGGCVFYVCGPDEVAPPETCTQTFKLQDQSGNPLNGNVQIGITAVTVLGTGTITLEKGKSYTAVASFSDQPTQTQTFTACTTTTFVFNVVPDVGTLSIFTEPPGASIFIQFVPFGVTPRENLEFPLGVHNVLLTKEGYHDVTKEVTLQAGIPGIISETLTMLEPEPEPEPDPGGYIGTISHKFTGDEIKIFVPVTNIWTKETCFYVDLRDQSGAFVEKAPMLLQSVKLAPGESGTITIDSYGAINPSWNVTDVQGQTLSLELKGIASIIGQCSIPPIGYTIIHTKSYDVPMPPDIDPEPEPDPDPVPEDGYIGAISHEFSGGEIKILVPITNIWTKEVCFYVDLRTQSGLFLEKAPMLLQTVKLAPGESGTITIDSYGALNPPWNAAEVQGQTVSLELKGIASIIGQCSIPPIGYTIIHTKSYDVPMPPDIDPDPVIGNLGRIENISANDIRQQIGNDEITLTIDIYNPSNKEQCYILKMYNEAGDFIAKAPTSIIPGQLASKVIEGGSLMMILDSNWQFWHINDIEGQTLTFKLFGFPTKLGACPLFEGDFSVYHTKEFIMEAYDDFDKDVFVPGDLLGVDPLLEVPMLNVNKVTFKGVGNPDEAIYIYQDKSFEIDDLITSFECDSEGKYSGEYDFDTGSYKIYAKKSGALGKESERHNVIVIDVIHLVLLLMALGLTIWKIRRK